MSGYNVNDDRILDRFEYDERDRMVRRTTGNGTVTEWIYDDQNEKKFRLIAPSTSDARAFMKSCARGG